MPKTFTFEEMFGRQEAEKPAAIPLLPVEQPQQEAQQVFSFEEMMGAPAATAVAAPPATAAEPEKRIFTFDEMMQPEAPAAAPPAPTKPPAVKPYKAQKLPEGMPDRIAERWRARQKELGRIITPDEKIDIMREMGLPQVGKFAQTKEDRELQIAIESTMGQSGAQTFSIATMHSMQSFAIGMLGTVAPEYAGEWQAETDRYFMAKEGWTAFAGEVLGNVLIFVPAALSGSAIVAGAGIAAAGISAGGATRSEIAERRKMGQDIGALEEIFASFGNAVVEAGTELFGYGVLTKFGKTLVKSASKLTAALKAGNKSQMVRIVAGAIRSTAAASGQGAVEEAAAQLGQNIVNKLTFAPETQVLQGVGKAALMGAIASPILGGVAALGRKFPSRKAQEAKVPDDVFSDAEVGTMLAEFLGDEGIPEQAKAMVIAEAATAQEKGEKPNLPVLIDVARKTVSFLSMSEQAQAVSEVQELFDEQEVEAAKAPAKPTPPVEVPKPTAPEAIDQARLEEAQEIVQKEEDITKAWEAHAEDATEATEEALDTSLSGAVDAGLITEAEKDAVWDARTIAVEPPPAAPEPAAPPKEPKIKPEEPEARVLERVRLATERARGEGATDIGEPDTTPTTQAETDASAFAESRGKTLAFVDSKQMRGWTDGKTILVARRQGVDALWTTVAHEVAHATKLDARKIADKARLLEYEKKALAMAKTISPAYNQKMKRDPSFRRREATALLIGDVMADPKVRARLQANNPSLYAKVVEAIKRVIGTFTVKGREVEAVLKEFREGVAAPVEAPPARKLIAKKPPVKPKAAPPKVAKPTPKVPPTIELTPEQEGQLEETRRMLADASREMTVAALPASSREAEVVFTKSLNNIGLTETEEVLVRPKRKEAKKGESQDAKVNREAANKRARITHEAGLINRAKKGDPDAPLLLMANQIGWIRNMARKYAGKNQDFTDDLVNNAVSTMHGWMSQNRSRRPSRKPGESQDSHEERLRMWETQGAMTVTQLQAFKTGIRPLSSALARPIQGAMGRHLSALRGVPHAKYKKAPESVSISTAAKKAGVNDAELVESMLGETAPTVDKGGFVTLPQEQRDTLNGIVSDAKRLRTLGNSEAQIASILGISEEAVGYALEPRAHPGQFLPFFEYAITPAKPRGDVALPIYHNPSSNELNELSRNTLKKINQADIRGLYYPKADKLFIIDGDSLHEWARDAIDSRAREAKGRAAFNMEILNLDEAFIPTEDPMHMYFDPSGDTVKWDAWLVGEEGVTGAGTVTAMRKQVDASESIKRMAGEKGLAFGLEEPGIFMAGTGKMKVTDFQKRLLSALKEKPKVTGRPHLANIGLTEERRRAVDVVHQAMKDEGVPSRETQAEWDKEGAAIAADPAMRAKLEQAVLSGEPLNATETSAAQIVGNEHAEKAVTSLAAGKPSKTAWGMMIAFTRGYTEGGTELARAMRARVDRMKKPGERMKEFALKAIATMPRGMRDKVAKLEGEIGKAEAKAEAATKAGDVALVAFHEGVVSKKQEQIDKISEGHMNAAEAMLAKWKKAGIDIMKIDQFIDDNPGEEVTVRAMLTSDIRKIIESNGGWDVLHELYRNFLMSAPLTFVRNMFGGIYAVYTSHVRAPMQRAIDETIRTGKPTLAREQTRQAFRAMYNGTTVSRAAYNMYLSWVYEVGAHDVSIEAEAELADIEIYSAPAITGKATKKLLSKVLDKRFGTAGGWGVWGLGQVIRTPQRNNMAIDQFVKTIHSAGEVAAAATNFGLALGLKPNTDAMDIYVDAQLRDLSSKSWDVAIARSETNISTFQAEATAIEELALKLRRKYPVLGIVLFPFVKTPVQLAGQAAIHTPMLGLPYMAYRALRHKSGRSKYKSQEVARHAASNLVGMVVLGMLWNLVGEDDEEAIITGPIGYTSAERKERMIRAQVRPPMHIWIGGVPYSYRNLEPFSTIMGAAISSIEGMKKMFKGEPVGKEVAGLMNKHYSMFSDQTYARAVGDLMKMAQDPEIYSQRYFTNLGAGWMPNIVDTSLRAGDPKIRERRLFGEDDTRPDIFQTIRREALPTANVLPPPKVTVWGEDIEKVGISGTRHTNTWFLNMVMPFVPRDPAEGKQGDLLRMLLIWNKRNPDNSKWFTEPAHTVNIRIPGQIRKQSVQMDNEDFHLTAKLGGLLASRGVERVEFNLTSPTEIDIIKLSKIIEAAHRKANDFVQVSEQLKAFGKDEQAAAMMQRLRDLIERLEAEK